MDDHCRTNLPDIYAAGDCAAVFDPLFGKHRIVDHWENARITGALAGANMAGADERYDAVSYFSSDVFGLPMRAWGEARQVDRRLLRGVPSEEHPMMEIGIAADGRIAQIVALGRGPDDELLRELVRRRTRIDGHEESLKDPLQPLRDLVA